jgi:glycosyltransferase involved in cell wall biosynthesis
MIKGSIGFDAKRAFNNHSGLGNYSRDHIRMCAEYLPEYQYKLFTPKSVESLEKFHLNLAQVERVSPTRGLGKISPSWWRSFGMLPELRSHGVSIFHGLSASLPAGLNRWEGKKIVTVHDLIFEKFPRWYKRADRVLHRRKLKHAVNAADTVVAISQETAQDLVDIYRVPEAKIRVIYQSCHPAFRIPEHTPLPAGLPEEYVLYVGSIEERKHLGELLEVVKKVKSIPLIAVGKPTAYHKKLEPAIQELQRKGLYYHLQPDTVTLASLYQNALFSVYPSQAEGFGIPVIESLFTGTPVLAGSSACLKEAGDDGALYVNPLDIKDFEKQFRRLLSNESLRAELSLAGRAHVEKFQPHILAQEWAKVYAGF